MALKQHKDKNIMYEQQRENSATYVMPFIEQTKPLGAGVNVLEIGTGEGGVLTPLIHKGCYCVGVDLDQLRIDRAHEFLGKEIAEGKALFLSKNVYDPDFVEKYKGFFDLIILKDTIEHIPNQEQFMPHMKQFLRSGGQIFFGFPPWFMPFGGHQQLAENKWTSRLPYYHILPMRIYKWLLKIGGEAEGKIAELQEIKETEITIERFERIVKKSGYKVLNKQHYLINPIYRYKFGLQPRKQFGIISAIPYVRDFLTTCVYYTIGL